MGFIVLQTKRPMNLLHKKCERYSCNKGLERPHQYYFSEDVWKHEIRIEHNRRGEPRKHIIMTSDVSKDFFTIVLNENADWFYYSEGEIYG